MLVDKKNDKIKFHFIPRTDKEFKSVAYSCIKFNDSYRFLSVSLDKLVETLNNDDLKISQRNFQRFAVF